MRRKHLAVLIAAGMLGIALPVHAGAQNAVRNVSHIGRRWLRGSWTSVSHVSSQSGDLSHNLTLALSGQMLYVYDFDTHRLSAFTISGQPKWRMGSHGTRPGQFDLVRDIKVDATGRVWATDPMLDRITILGPSGTVLRTIDGVERIDQIALAKDGSFWGEDAYHVAPRLYDSLGRHPRAVPLPPQLRKLGDMERDFWLSSTAGDTLIVAYAYGDPFVVVSGESRHVREYHGVEHHPFAPVHPDSLDIGGQHIVAFKATAAMSACYSISVDHGLLYELFANGPVGSPDRHRTVDVYRIANGQYVGSYRLPEDVSSLHVEKGYFAAVLRAPGDGLQVWKWVPDTSAAQ